MGGPIVAAILPGLGRASFQAFWELTEDECGCHPVSRKAMTYQQFLLARVHRPDALRQLGLGLCHTSVLSEVFSPRIDSHFRPEGAGLFEDFIDTVEEGPVA